MRLYVAVYLVFIYLLLFNKSLKLNRVLGVSIFIFMLFYSGLRENDADYKNYYEMYQGIRPMASYGYMKLVQLGNFFSLNYKEFLFIVSTINMYLLILFFSYKNNNIYITLLSYLGYFFIIKNMNQYRNLLAYLLIYNFIINIFYKKKRVCFL